MNRQRWELEGVLLVLLSLVVFFLFLLAIFTPVNAAPIYPPLVERTLLTFRKAANAPASEVQVSYRLQRFMVGAADCPSGNWRGGVFGYAMLFTYRGVVFEYMADPKGGVAMCHVVIT